MSRGWIVRWVAAVVGAAMVSLLLPFACQEIESVGVEVSRPTREQLDQIAARGWLPDFLPAPAEFLILRYDIDTNRRCARFTYSSAQLEELVLNATLVGFEHTETPPAPRRISLLEPCPISEQDLAGATAFKRSRSHQSIYSESLAVDPIAGRAYLWDFIE